MTHLIAASIIGVLGALVAFLKPTSQAMLRFVGIAVLSTVVLTIVFYLQLPTFVYALWLPGSLWILLPLVLGVIVNSLDGSQYSENQVDLPAVVVLAIALVLFVGTGFFAGSFANAPGMAQQIGAMGERIWTQDVQPKDPAHVRLVPKELALYLAGKQLGQAGAIGSQFQIDKERMTLQMIGHELWYVAPLEYTGFSVYSSGKAIPGYVKVHGEDPNHPVTVVSNLAFTCSPSAWFSNNLERTLWQNGYAIGQGVYEIKFELDDQEKPWWVASIYRGGPGMTKQTTGVVLVNPTDGATTYYALKDVPAWVERVVPRGIAQQNATNWGLYHDGWLNTLWGKQGLLEPEEPSLVYGASNTAYWVMCITSLNKNDEALVALAVYAAVARRALRLRQEPDLFVEPDGGDLHPGGLGQEAEGGIDTAGQCCNGHKQVSSVTL